MIRTICSDIHPGRGQLGITQSLTVSSSGDLTPSGSLGLDDYYHILLITPTSPSLQLTLPSGTNRGYQLTLVNMSGTDFTATDGGQLWTVEGTRSRIFLFSDFGWHPLDYEMRTRPFDKPEIRFGYLVTSFAASERAYVGDIDPAEFKVLDAVVPSSIDDAENYAYFDRAGSLCHFNFRSKRGGVYNGNAAWFNASIATFTFALHIDMPSPHRATSFVSLGYAYSLNSTLVGDDTGTPRDITGIILPDRSDPTKAFIIYTYYGQRVFVGDITGAVASVDYTFFGSGTYRVQV